MSRDVRTFSRLQQRLYKRFQNQCYLPRRGVQIPCHRICMIHVCLDFLDVMDNVHLDGHYKLFYPYQHREMEVIGDQVHIFVMHLLKHPFENPYVSMRQARRTLPEHLYYRLNKAVRQTGGISNVIPS